LGCSNIVQGAPGQLSATYAGEEFRHQDHAFQSYDLRTKVYAQKLIDGQWKRVGHTSVMHGVLGETYPRPPWVVAPFTYADYMIDSTEARFFIPVYTAGQYRVEVATRDINQDGVHLVKLDDTTSTSCTVVGS